MHHTSDARVAEGDEETGYNVAEGDGGGLMRLVRVLRVERALQDAGFEVVRPPADQGRRAEEEANAPAEDNNSGKDSFPRPLDVDLRMHHVDEPG